MIRCFVAAAAAAILIAGLAGGARADDRAEIDGLYAKLEQALKNRTPEATLALETPDFVSRSPTGQPISGKALVQEMKQQNAGVKSIKDVSIKVTKCVITGKRAKATTDFRYAVEVEDPEGHMGPKGATHEMTMSGLVKNDLVKTAAGWKFKTMEQGRGKIMVDGKPVPAAPAGTKPARKKR